MDLFSVELDEGAIRKEKDKARRFRQSQWWKRQLDRGCCHYCRKRVPPSELTMDHIVPLVRGGKTKKGNVVPACKECNNKKKYLLPVEWDSYLNSLTESDSR